MEVVRTTRKFYGKTPPGCIECHREIKAQRYGKTTIKGQPFTVQECEVYIVKAKDGREEWTCLRCGEALAAINKETPYETMPVSAMRGSIDLWWFLWANNIEEISLKELYEKTQCRNGAHKAKIRQWLWNMRKTGRAVLMDRKKHIYRFLL